MSPVTIQTELATLLDRMSVTDVSAREYAMSLVNRLEDESGWRAMDQQALKGFIYEGVCFYGQISWEPMVQLLMPVYAHGMAQLSSSERIELLAAVRQRIEVNQTSMNALMPFVYVDIDPGVVSTAAVDYVVLAAPEEGDALSWARALVANLNAGVGANKGAILGGLVSLGDRSLNEFLVETRWLLSDPEVATAGKCVADRPCIGALEFWLAWLEELVGAGLAQSTLFKNVAGGLSLLPRQKRDAAFVDVTHNFDYPRDAHAGVNEALNQPNPGGGPETVHSERPLSAIAEDYSERLYAIEAAESAPRYASAVLSDFGLEARAPMDERGTL